MALVLKDRVKQFTVTNGTGTLTLGATVTGFDTFSSSIGNGNTTYYAIYHENTTEWEVGVGTVGANTISRDTVLSSSNNNLLVNFTDGSKVVWCDYPASKSVYLDQNNNAVINNGIVSPNYVEFDTSYATPLTAGQLGWNGNNTLGLGMIGGNVVQHIGEDTFFYVKASSAITKGQLCMFTGAVGSSGVLTAAPATAIPYAEAIIGVAAENIAKNGFGLIQNTGTLKGVNTSAFSDGDILYYNSAVTGGFTNVFPASGPIVVAAAVAKSGSGGSGILTVRISFQTRVTAGTGISVTQGNDSVTVTNTSPNTYDPSNVAITGGTINGTSIGATTPSTGVFTTLTATGQTSLGGVAGSESFRAVPVASSVSWVEVQGNAGTQPRLSVNSAGADLNFAISSKGTGALRLYTATFAQEQMRVSHTASAVNYVQVTGAATGAAPTITPQGSDTNIAITVAPKGGGSINLSGFTRLGFNSSNYFNASGSAAGLEPVISAAGADTNISLALQSKGTGGVDLATGSTGVNISNGTTVTALTRTALGSGYTSSPTITIGAPQLPGGVQATATVTVANISQTIVSGGSGYTVNDVITVSGGTFISQAQFTVTSVSAGVITGLSQISPGSYTVMPPAASGVTGGTGTGATVTLIGGMQQNFTITNAGSGYVEQPTVTFSGGGGSGAAAYATVGTNTSIRGLSTTFSLSTPGGEQLRVSDPGNSTADYVQISGGANPFIATGGASANSSLSISSRGTGSLNFRTNGVALNQMLVTHTASAVNYVQVTGAATTGTPNISAQGSDTNIPIYLTSKGTGAVRFFTNGAGSEQFRVAHTAGTIVNYSTVTGSVTGSAPVFSVAGTDTNIGLTLEAKGSSAINLHNAATSTSFGVELGTNTTVDKATFIDFHSSSGTDYDFRIIRFGSVNANADFVNLGTGVVRTLTGGGEQFRVSNTASAVNYFQVTGAATSGVPVFSVEGSDASISMLLRAKGGQPFRFFTSTGNAEQFRVNHTAGTIVNYAAVTGSATGAAPTFSVAGTDTNIGLDITSKGTGSVNLNTGNGTAFQANQSFLSGTAANYVFASSRQASSGPVFGAAGSDANIGLFVTSKGTGNLTFTTNNGGNNQFIVAHTASAVNFVQVTGGATGVASTISTQGSDSTISLNVTTKGAGAFIFASQNGSSRQFRIDSATAAVNHLQVGGNTAGNAPVLSSQGTDTNIDITLTPKGTGNVRFGTHTATSDTAISGYIEIKDASGTIRKLAVIT
jgi:hypothetical protein